MCPTIGKLSIWDYGCVFVSCHRLATGSGCLVSLACQKSVLVKTCDWLMGIYIFLFGHLSFFLVLLICNVETLQYSATYLPASCMQVLPAVCGPRVALPCLPDCLITVFTVSPHSIAGNCPSRSSGGALQPKKKKNVQALSLHNSLVAIKRRATWKWLVQLFFFWIKMQKKKNPPPSSGLIVK